MPNKPDLPCADCGELMWRSTSSLPEGQARCRPCRRKRPPAKRARPGPPCPTCGVPMAANAAGTHPCMACRKAGGRSVGKGASRQCEVCGIDYRATYGEQRTCGRACGAVINSRIAAAVPRSSPIEWHDCAECGRTMSCPRRVVCSTECRTARAARLYREAFESRAQRTSRPCEDCGETYTTQTAHNKGVCLRCQKRRHKAAFGSTDRKRARAYGVEYEPVSRAKVYERDAWRCGLCGKKVRKDKKAPHPLSPSLDHVIPMSQGGPHTYANVQCAHFLCNSLKGVGGSQQLALVG